MHTKPSSTAVQGGAWIGSLLATVTGQVECIFLQGAQLGALAQMQLPSTWHAGLCSATAAAGATAATAAPQQQQEKLQQQEKRQDFRSQQQQQNNAAIAPVAVPVALLCAWLRPRYGVVRGRGSGSKPCSIRLQGRGKEHTVGNMGLGLAAGARHVFGCVPPAARQVGQALLPGHACNGHGQRAECCQPGQMELCRQSRLLRQNAGNALHACMSARLPACLTLNWSTLARIRCHIAERTDTEGKS